MSTPSKPVIAIDFAYQEPHFGTINKSGVVTTFDYSRFQLTKDHFAALAKRYQAKHFLITGPGTEFLPEQSGAFTFTKIARLDALSNGIQTLAEVSPLLVIMFELGCHLFYHQKDTVYLGSLPYNFTSFGLEDDLSVATEMGQELQNALAICATHKLPHTRMLDRYETLIAYTLALGIKEFLSRYQINQISIVGTITTEQKDLLASFLLPPKTSHFAPHTSNSSLSSESVALKATPTVDHSPNSTPLGVYPDPQRGTLRSPLSIVPLLHPEHIAIFGMLNPYFQTDAREN